MFPAGPGRNDPWFRESRRPSKDHLQEGNDKRHIFPFRHLRSLHLLSQISPFSTLVPPDSLLNRGYTSSLTSCISSDLSTLPILSAITKGGRYLHTRLAIFYSPASHCGSETALAPDAHLLALHACSRPPKRSKSEDLESSETPARRSIL